MHAGDNMLAIYASEKALRLAERLGETRVASRAHGIFGRVFGRIGDTAKARENLERSVELARDSDEAETIRALLTLGHHLEVSEADYAGAERGLRRGARAGRQIGDLPAQVELHRGDRAGRLLPRRLGGGRARERRRAPTSPSARAWSASSASRACCAASWPGARATGTTPSRALPPRARAGRAGRLVRGRVRGALLARRDAARPRRPRGRRPELDRALDVCERAGLIAQSIEAMSARAIDARRWPARSSRRREAAEEAGHLAERLHYPVGQAAALRGPRRDAPDPRGGAELLREARELWAALGRPLDAARCELLAGRALREVDPEAAAAALEDARAAFERARRASTSTERAPAALAAGCGRAPSPGSRPRRWPLAAVAGCGGAPQDTRTTVRPPRRHHRVRRLPAPRRAACPCAGRSASS